MEKTSSYFLEKGYCMHFNTPRGNYSSKEYSFEKHIEHYLIFFYLHPLFDRAEITYSFSFPDDQGNLIYMYEYLLKESVMAFDESENINVHANSLLDLVRNGEAIEEEDKAFLDIFILMNMEMGKRAVKFCEKQEMDASSHQKKLDSMQNLYSRLQEY